jgi:ammonia channel protein AmtB
MRFDSMVVFMGLWHLLVYIPIAHSMWFVLLDALLSLTNHVKPGMSYYIVTQYLYVYYMIYIAIAGTQMVYFFNLARWITQEEMSFIFRLAWLV